LVVGIRSCINFIIVIISRRIQNIRLVLPDRKRFRKLSLLIPIVRQVLVTLFFTVPVFIALQRITIANIIEVASYLLAILTFPFTENT
jgi:hypothetical protein